MANISDVSAYICVKYPHKQELSKARLTKLVYLADWKSAQIMGKQLTSIKWYFHNYGPYVDDVRNAVFSDDRFIVTTTSTMYGDAKTLFSVKENIDSTKRLKERQMKIIDDVIDKTKNLYWDAFIQYVYNTFPIRATNRYEALDLVMLSKKESRLKDRSQV